MIDLETLSKLEAAATPGPWESRDAVVLKGNPAWILAQAPEHDVPLIAAARNALPALLREVKAARRWLTVEDEDWENLPSERVIVARMAYRKVVEENDG